MKRHPTTAALAAVSLAIVLLSGCQPKPHLNLVMICIDTVRYDSFMQVGVPDELDRWLERAQVYDNAVATGPWTIPSVASALTGLYPVEHGAGHFEGEIANLDTDPPSGLAAEAQTLAEILGQHGLRSGAFVSHPFFTAGLGLEQGFEVVRKAKGWETDVKHFRTWQGRLDPADQFFAYLHFMEAHDLHKQNTERLIEQLDRLDPALRRDVRERAARQACREEDNRRCYQHQRYNAAVLELRAAVASVLAGLEESGLLERTVVLLYSDHGEEFWEHRRQQAQLAEDPRGKYGFGHGQSMYQELLHVPLLAWHPERPGARHAATVSLVDIVPTVMQWLNVDATDHALSGKLLPGTGKKRRKEEDKDRVVFASGIAYGVEKVATRSGPLKSVYTLRDDRFEFYDLQADPTEKAPLDGGPLLMAFDTLTGDYLEQPNRFAVAASQFSAKQIEELKAVGYLQGAAAEPGPRPSAGQDASEETGQQPKSGRSPSPAAEAEPATTDTMMQDEGPTR